MAAQPMPELMRLEEYLSTAFHPDCEFVDGVVEERTMGSTRRSLLQLQLGFWFISHRQEWQVRVASELRTQVAQTRVRLPDVAVIPELCDLSERVRTVPPLIAIEILSPEDRLNRVVLRLDEFVRMGVPEVWLLDPQERVAYRYHDGGLRLVQESRLTLPGSPIYLDLPELFAALD